MKDSNITQHTNPSLGFLKNEDNPVILLDIDGVSAETREFFHGIIEDKYGIPLSPSRLKSSNPRIPEINSSYSEEVKSLVKNDITIYRDVEPTLGAAEATRKLSEEYKIYIVTHRVREKGWMPDRRSEMRDITVNWLKENGFEFDEFICPAPVEKADIEHSILIDDRSKNIKPSVSKNESIGIMFLRSYNIMEIPRGCWVASAYRGEKHGDCVSKPDKQWSAITDALLEARK